MSGNPGNNPPPKADAAALRWEHFPHGADISLRGFVRAMDEAFEAVAATAGLARKVARLVPLVCNKG